MLGYWKVCLFSYLLTTLILINILRDVLSSESITALDKARDEALGPREDRTSDAATFSNGTYHGGIAFERSARAIKVQNARCYNMGISYQQQPSLNAPCAGGKLEEGMFDEDLKKRRFMVKVS